jgi:hypothetical protein
LLDSKSGPRITSVSISYYARGVAEAMWPSAVVLRKNILKLLSELESWKLKLRWERKAEFGCRTF